MPESLPENVSTFTLTFGSYRNAVGRFALGGRKARLFPVDETGKPVRLIHPATGLVIVPEPVTVKVNAEGTSSVGPLPHTDNETLSPLHFRWKLEWVQSAFLDNHPEIFVDKMFAAPASIGAALDYDRVGGLAPDGSPPVISDGGTIDLSAYALKSDPRFTDSRTPTTHTHPAPDLTGYVQTNDPRLTNSRPPSAHTHAAEDISGLVYYTDERAQDAAASLFTGGSHTGVTYTYNDETGKVDSVVTGGGAPAVHSHSEYATQSALTTGLGARPTYSELSEAHYTKTQSDARYAAAGSTGTNTTVTSDGSNPKLGILSAALATAYLAPSAFVFAGDSITAGANATAAARKWVHVFAKRLQGAYPSGLGSETAIQDNDSATFTLRTTAGVHAYNLGHGGTTADSYITTDERTRIVALNPRVIFHTIGVNDYRGSKSAATFRTQLEAQIDGLNTALGSAKVLHILVRYGQGSHPGTPSAGATWADYGTAQKAIADARANVLYLDLHPAWEAAGGMADPLDLWDTDGFHPNDRGHSFVADLIYRALGLPMGGSTVTAAPAEPTTLTNTTPPLITGTATTGSTLSVSNGSWTPTPEAYAYQWYRGSTAIANTGWASTYLLTQADEGQVIRCDVAAQKNGYATVTVTSSNTVTPTVTPTATPASTSGDTGPALAELTTPTYGTGKFGNSRTVGRFAVDGALSGVRTIECWFKIAAGHTGTQVIIGDNANSAWVATNGPQITSQLYGTGGATKSGGTTANDGNWHHVALSMDATTGTRLFLDGVQIADWPTAVDAKTLSASGNSRWGIGGFVDGSFAFTGSIDEVRISSTARYTANFTPPTEAFVSDASTLALYHLEGLPQATVSDNFNRTDQSGLGTAPTGQTWTPIVVSGTGTSSWSIGSNQARGFSSTATDTICVVDGGSSRGDLSVTVVDHGPYAMNAGLAFRVADGANLWLWSAVEGKYCLYVRINGTYTLVSDPNIASADGDVLRVVTAGDLITCYVNGVQRVQITDARLNTNTKVGIRTANGDTNTPALFDNFSFAAVTATPVTVTDNFTRADSASLGTTETGGVTWQTTGSGWDIFSTALRFSGAADQAAVVNTGRSDNWELSFTLTSITGGYPVTFVWGSAAAFASMSKIYRENSTGAWKLALGSGGTTIAKTTAAPVNGDVLILRKEGTTLTLLSNGVQIAQWTGWSSNNTAADTFQGVAGAGNVPLTIDNFRVGGITLNETWTGTDGAAWPSGWTTLGATSTIQSNRGRLVPTTYWGASHLGSAASVTGDFDITVDAAMTGQTGSATQLAVGAGSGNLSGLLVPANGYGATVAVALNGTLSHVNLYRGATSNSAELAFAYVAGSPGTNGMYSIRLQKVGSVVRMRVWPKGAAEPSTWSLSHTDTAPPSGPFKPHVGSGSNTNGTTVVEFDNLVFTPGTPVAASSVNVGPALTLLRGTRAHGAGKFGNALTGGVLSASNTARHDIRTVECWARTPAGSTAILVAVRNADTINSQWLGFEGSQVFTDRSGGTNKSSGLTLNDGNWHHLAVSMDGTTLRLFADGVLTSQTSYTGSYSLAGLAIGGHGSTTGYDLTTLAGGGVDEVRLSTTARYTAAFTPPTAPFETDANTVILYHLESA